MLASNFLRDFQMDDVSKFVQQNGTLILNMLDITQLSGVLPKTAEMTWYVHGELWLP